MVPEQWGQGGLPWERRGSCVGPSWSWMGLQPLASPRAGRACPRPVTGASLAMSLNHPHSGEVSSTLARYCAERRALHTQDSRPGCAECLAEPV